MFIRLSSCGVSTAPTLFASFIVSGVSINAARNAIVKAIAEASKTIDYLSEVKIIEQRANIDGNKISEYFVDLDISFIVDLDRKNHLEGRVEK